MPLCVRLFRKQKHGILSASVFIRARPFCLVNDSTCLPHRVCLPAKCCLWVLLRVCDQKHAEQRGKCEVLRTNRFDLLAHCCCSKVCECYVAPKFPLPPVTAASLPFDSSGTTFYSHGIQNVQQEIYEIL